MQPGTTVKFPYPVESGERDEDGAMIMKDEWRYGTVIAIGGPAVLVRPESPPTFRKPDPSEQVIGESPSTTKHDRVVRHVDSVRTTTHFPAQ